MGEKTRLKIHLDKRNIKMGSKNGPKNGFLIWSSLPYLIRGDETSFSPPLFQSLENRLNLRLQDLFVDPRVKVSGLKWRGNGNDEKSKKNPTGLNRLWN